MIGQTKGTREIIRERVRLRDGRWLGYAEYGDPGGSTLFLFHGQPGNRLFRHPNDELTAACGVRLIVPDRPGYGLSSSQPRRSILDWPDDILQLGESLNLNRFSILGFSGGGPYALACARNIPDRLEKVILVSSAPPLYQPQFRHEAPVPLRINFVLSHYTPALMHLLFRLYWRASLRDPEQFLRAARRQSGPTDQLLFDRPEVYRLMLAVWQENLRVHPKGYVQDAILLMRPWGFDLDEVKSPIYIIQGEEDANIPASWGVKLAQGLPSAHFTLIPDSGHFVLFERWEQILNLVKL